MSYVVLSHVATGDVATAALHNTLLDDIVIIKTSIADDGRLSGEIKNFSEDAPSVAISSNVLTLDMAVENVVRVSLNANITTTTINNKPASGKFGSITLIVTADGSARTWAFLTGTVKWGNAGAPTLTITNGKVDVFMIFTVDNGTTWYGLNVTQNN